jgi:hypothetical protein
MGTIGIDVANTASTNAVGVGIIPADFVNCTITFNPHTPNTFGYMIVILINTN